MTTLFFYLAVTIVVMVSLPVVFRVGQKTWPEYWTIDDNDELTILAFYWLVISLLWFIVLPMAFIALVPVLTKGAFLCIGKGIVWVYRLKVEK